MKVNVFILELRRELSRSFREEEVEEVVSYYEEIINDRIENGEDEKTILAEYDPRQIARMLGPSIVVNRNEYKAKDAYTGSKSLFMFLITTPILIPIGVLYLVFLILMICLQVTCLGAVLGGIGWTGGLIYELVVSKADFGIVMAFIGAILIGTAVIALCCRMINAIVKGMSKGVLKIATKLVGKKNTIIGGNKR